MTTYASESGSEIGNYRAKLPQPQQFLNGEVHDWYRIVLGYSDHLVSKLIDDFDLPKGANVLDPFCGTGTTLIECMKRDIDCTGIDANPSSVFAAKAKTDWSLSPAKLKEYLDDVKSSYEKFKRRRTSYKLDPTYLYIESSGMIERKWISPQPLRMALAVKSAIIEAVPEVDYRNSLLLALVSEVVEGISNVKFGPQLYCGPEKMEVNVIHLFESRVERVIKDLKSIGLKPPPKAAEVFKGDSRDVGLALRRSVNKPFQAIICSPPYPTEHDYTRHSRLELAFLEFISDNNDLRAVKKGMIRSHTKGIYSTDSDKRIVHGNDKIKHIADRLEVLIKEKTHGFAKLYPKLVYEYFGGMMRHLISARSVLAPDAVSAYVVGDQSSYLQVHIPTARIMAELAEDAGYEVVKIDKWRSRWSSSTSREIDEHILVIKKRS